MSKYGNWSLVALAALVLVGGAVRASTAGPVAGGDTAPTSAASAAGTELRDVVVNRDAAGHPSVTLAGSGPMTYRTLELENPQRLVVDLPGTVSRLDRNQVAIDDGGVLRVRAGQFRRTPTPVSRVVVDLEGPVPYRI